MMNTTPIKLSFAALRALSGFAFVTRAALAQPMQQGEFAAQGQKVNAHWAAHLTK